MEIESNLLWRYLKGSESIRVGRREQPKLTEAGAQVAQEPTLEHAGSILKRFQLFFVALFVFVMVMIPLSQKVYSSQTNPYAVIEKKFKVMNQILYYVNQLYYEDVDMESLMDGAFKGIKEPVS